MIPLAQPVLERDGGFAEDHLRAQVAAVDTPVEHRRRHHQEHQEHQGEEDDAELVDPEFVAGEVEALPRNIEADHVEERQRQESQEAEQVDALAQAGASLAVSAGGIPGLRSDAAPEQQCARQSNHARRRASAIAPAAQAQPAKDEATPMASSATAVPRPKASMVSAPASGAAGSMAFSSAA